MSRPDDREVENELEALRRQHLKLDQQVQELDGRRFLTEEEDQEVKRLKKLKLATKDKMRHLRPEA
jgi:hypothetical protein